MRTVAIRIFGAFLLVGTVLMMVLVIGSCVDGNTNTNAGGDGMGDDNDGNGDNGDGDGMSAESCTGAGASVAASYRLTFSSNWTVASSGMPTPLPTGAHLTTLYGATHNADYTIWAVDGLATPGVESVAEDGATGTLQKEIEAKQTEGSAQNIVQAASLRAVGSATATFKASCSHPLLSVMSMVAPTPDWFVGVSNLSLLDDDKNWRKDITIDLRIYDAGTEQDTMLYSRGNAPENPHKAISRFPGSAAAGFLESANKHIIGSLRVELQ